MNARQRRTAKRARDRLIRLRYGWAADWRNIIRRVGEQVKRKHAQPVLIMPPS